MRAILGVDAAWTEAEPSGVALFVDEGAGWACRIVAPSYGAFIDACRGTPVDWSDTPLGVVPPVNALLDAARSAAGCTPSVVAIDMPMSLVAFSARRTADNRVSKEFGSRSCSAHSPSGVRPGPLGREMSEAFRHRGYRLATEIEARPSERALLEVYPHTALLALLGVGERVRYKVSKASKYWPGATVGVRIGRLLEAFGSISARARGQVGPPPVGPAIDCRYAGWLEALRRRPRCHRLGLDGYALSR